MIKSKPGKQFAAASQALCLQVLTDDPGDNTYGHTPLHIQTGDGKRYIVLFAGHPVVIAGVGYRIDAIGEAHISWTSSHTGRRCKPLWAAKACAWTGYPAPEAAEFEGFSFSSICDPPILNDFLMLNREQKNPHLSKQMWAFKWPGGHLGSKKAP